MGKVGRELRHECDQLRTKAAEALAEAHAGAEAVGKGGSEDTSDSQRCKALEEEVARLREQLELMASKEAERTQRQDAPATDVQEDVEQSSDQAQDAEDKSGGKGGYNWWWSSSRS